jgi:predicted nucleotidyltransferase
MNGEHTILKVLVGSQAHGLAEPASDADSRSVFVIPTAEMFRLGFKYQPARWIKGPEDEAAWEVGRFLSLAIQCHPLILEAFLAPVLYADAWGTELRTLFPVVWSPQQASASFLGYGENQRRKLLEKKDGRPEKYAAAYLRVLHNLLELLQTGTFTVRIAETEVGNIIARAKAGHLRTGEVIDLAEAWTQETSRLLAHCTHQPDFSRVDEYLVRIRRAFLA